jgi:hypothetical protein
MLCEQWWDTEACCRRLRTFRQPCTCWRTCQYFGNHVGESASHAGALGWGYRPPTGFFLAPVQPLATQYWPVPLYCCATTTSPVQRELHAALPKFRQRGGESGRTGQPPRWHGHVQIQPKVAGTQTCHMIMGVSKDGLKPAARGFRAAPANTFSKRTKLQRRLSVVTVDGVLRPVDLLIHLFFSFAVQTIDAMQPTA